MATDKDDELIDRAHKISVGQGDQSIWNEHLNLIEVTRQDERAKILEMLEKFDQSMALYNDAFGGSDVDMIKIQAIIKNIIQKIKELDEGR